MVLREARRERDLTLARLAEAAGLSVPYLGEIERGKKYPSVPVLERLAAALGLDVPDLLEMVADRMRGADSARATEAIGFALPEREIGAPRLRVRRLLQHLEPSEATTMAELGSFFIARRGGQPAGTPEPAGDEPPT
jgi:transcriptional regulator with XRE-family HTH domain